MTRDIRCYDYVPAPYTRVRRALVLDAGALLGQATAAAARRGDEVIATLSAPVGPLVVGADVVVHLGEITETVSALGKPMTRLDLRWTAVSRTSLLPSMEATLSVYPLTPRETQVDFHGRYRPPLGPLGDVVDGLVGYRIAEVSLQGFVDDIVGRLRGVVALAG